MITTHMLVKNKTPCSTHKNSTTRSKIWNNWHYECFCNLLMALSLNRLLANSDIATGPRCATWGDVASALNVAATVSFRRLPSPCDATAVEAFWLRGMLWITLCGWYAGVKRAFIQGCLTSWAAVGRLWGARWSISATRSFASCETCVQAGP